MRREPRTCQKELRKEEIQRPKNDASSNESQRDFVTNFSAVWFKHKFLCFHLVWFIYIYMALCKILGCYIVCLHINERNKQHSVWLSRENRLQPSPHYQLADADCRDGAQSDCISCWRHRYLIVREFERMI